MMSMTREFSQSILMALPFVETLALLREGLEREDFQIVAEVPFHQAFKRQMGLQYGQYTVLLVWSPFLAYQGLLSDSDAGVFMPFNIAVADYGTTTLIATTNHLLFGRLSGSIGIQVLARDLTRKIRQVFCDLSTREKPTTDLVPSGQRKEAP